MFKKDQFTHIAASNRDNIKFGVFVYKTTDPIETVMASGYFNDRLIDLQEHDIIFVVCEYTEIEEGVLVKKAKLEQLYVSEKTLDNIKTAYAVTGGSGEEYTEGEGINIVNKEISVDVTTIAKMLEVNELPETTDPNTWYAIVEE